MSGFTPSRAAQTHIVCGRAHKPPLRDVTPPVEPAPDWPRRAWGSHRTMNPLLFADWGRMNRLFTRVMWAVAIVMVCVVCMALAAPTPKSHAAATAHSAAPAAAAGASGGAVR
jgi:hypothetical protein